MDLIQQNTHTALSTAATSPSAELNAGRPPLPQTISIHPPNASAEAAQNLAYLTSTSSVAALQTAIFNEDFRVGRGQATHFDLGVAGEATRAFADMAAAGYRAMAGPLGVFYEAVAGGQGGIERVLARGDVRSAVLGEVFGGFGLGEGALRELDGMVRGFFAALGGVVFDDTQGATVDFAVRVNYVVRVEGEGEQDVVYQPRTRVVWVKVDAGSYVWAIGEEGAESAAFKMRYATYDFLLHVDRFLASKERFDVVFQGLLGEDIASYGGKIDRVVVNR
ncbi:hypothetical protein P153DRAFT_354113 [Dothidotthia symphoricarpi CBS 119687]|uniref:Uncharacterized protein n=1 Tax=Dothidotthia symphoricarpi CBS 119687 TaxID=1392245 RepID=A0A6A6ALE3_9PLEO|nr:uncharacterized protein P153DRAFT_354113 [Dothidotthia symphoricarpi CBS 119687]KAF2132620.1 hypothetical protein P153DRAFT_354113 [Dothidotthia symphoricarpi CBS 119687]